MPAIWNSYSKSDTARRPRRMMEAFCAHEIHQQAVEALDFDVGKIDKNPARDIHALGEVEQGLLLAALGDRDDDLLKQARGAPHQILVSARQRIEGPGIHGDGIVHACSSK
jgi:hypothetical protein